ncbi:MAG: nitrophenyl compound nitroreductase subunit ArsF family protein [Elusimicrobiota bacterium]|jgi:hypothetical protein
MMRRKVFLLGVALSVLSPLVMADRVFAVRPSTGTSKVVAYYFHSARRCPTCRKIEAYSAEALKKEFAKELASGSLEWRVVNIDEPANRHFIKDFGLYASSLVLVSQAKDKPHWKNLDQVWSLVKTPEAFARYVEDEVRQFQKGS